MRRFRPVFLLFLGLAVPASARHSSFQCGTTRETPRESMFLHRQAMRTRASQLSPRLASANRDIGNIAVIEDAGGVVARQNQFNLDLKTLQFAPAGTSYRYSVTDNGYDAAAASAGTALAALDDDDSRLITLPFRFPFFGTNHTQLYVNSDGNLTFDSADNASTDRSLGRATAGPPRVFPLFDDLDPALTPGGVRVLANSDRVVISWVAVPEWESFGVGPAQTFQVRLYPDGRIEFSYSGITASSAVVGIAPGNLQGTTTLADFRNDTSVEYSAGIAERFGNSLQIDIVTAAQTFYQTHEDSYDYLVIYNNEDIAAGEAVVAFENTVRNVGGSGYGVEVEDSGEQYGSPSRLQAVLNLGPLSQYPSGVTTLVGSRAPQGDTPLSIIGHEAGHLFLAYASVTDPSDPTVRPMIGAGNSHWSFAFNSEASLNEGERIVDRGPTVSPQFQTTDTEQVYSPLDQYLMGFRAPADVPDTFVVRGLPSYQNVWHPLRNVTFDGQRQNISVNGVMQAMGRRTPDSTVAQRRYRFAFILVVAQGTTPSDATIAKLDNFRKQFEGFYATASNNNGIADTSLARSLKLSLYPATGVVIGDASPASITVQTAPASNLTMQFEASAGNAKLPTSVTIPAGATTVSFAVTGVRAGVEEVTAVPSDPLYETASARIQVADAALLKLVAVSGDRQISNSAAPLPDPIVALLTDVNNLAYPGARVVASASTGGSVTPDSATTNAQGQASFQWTPGFGASNQLKLSVASAPNVSLTINAGSAVPVISSVISAASFAPGIAAGGFQAVQGVNLAGGSTATSSYPWPTTLANVQVLLNNTELPLTYISDAQINFYVPQDVPTGSGVLTVVTPSSARTTSPVAVAALQPGIFPGAIVHAGTATSALATPVQAGDYLEIYGTGLGPTHPDGTLQETNLTPTVFIGSVPVTPIFSGLTPGLLGLYQVDIQVPAGLAPGVQEVLLSTGASHSNAVPITVK